MQNRKSAEGLTRRLLRAGGWVLGGHATSQALRLLGNLLMTRLLAPEMFGVMALAHVFVIGLNMFSDVGLKQVVVQSNRGEDRLFLNTVWSVQIVRGGLIFVLGILLAGALAIAQNIIPHGSTYSNPALPFVLAWLSLTAIVAGFESTKLLTAGRGLDFGRLTLIELISQIFGLGLMATWAIASPSIYSLVAGAIISALIRTVLSHLWMAGENNRWTWHVESVHEIFKFGKWIFLTSILGFLIASGDRLLMGGLFSADTMGNYAIAVLLLGAVQELVNKLIGSVVYPAMGEIKRRDGVRLNELYCKIRRPIDMFCLGAAGFLFFAGQTIVGILYDERYVEAGVMLEILGLTLIALRYGVAGQFYIAIGQPNISAYLMIIRLISLILFVFFGNYLGGNMGAVWGVSVSVLPTILMNLFYFKPKVGIFNYKFELFSMLYFAFGLLLGYFSCLYF